MDHANKLIAIRRSLPALAVGVMVASCLICLTGCIHTRSYVPICGPSDLSSEQVEQLLGSPSPAAEDLPGVGILGERVRWIPLVFTQASRNNMRSGPTWLPGPEVYVVKEPDEKWIEARDSCSVGPLSLLWRRTEHAYFDPEGRNFGYFRASRTLWGFLWSDWRAKTLSPTAEETHGAGFLFAGFGYGSKRSRDAAVKYVRLLWIPIPVSW